MTAKSCYVSDRLTPAGGLPFLFCGAYAEPADDMVPHSNNSTTAHRVVGVGVAAAVLLVLSSTETPPP